MQNCVIPVSGQHEEAPVRAYYPGRMNVRLWSVPLSVLRRLRATQGHHSSFPPGSANFEADGIER